MVGATSATFSLPQKRNNNNKKEVLNRMVMRQMQCVSARRSSWATYKYMFIFLALPILNTKISTHLLKRIAVKIDASLPDVYKLPQ